MGERGDFGKDRKRLISTEKDLETPRNACGRKARVGISLQIPEELQEGTSNDEGI